MPRAMSGTPANRRTRGSGHGFGTMPVFLAGISTILGAIMFLRFGYAVAHTGLAGSIAIILLGHLVTIPTALAISEIATNRKVEGGGEYYIVSRSFGLRIGSALGTSLYLSQAISVAFYCIAFAEAFRPLAPGFESLTGIAFDPRMVSLPAALVILFLALKRGASMGVRALWVVVGILLIALAFFFAGSPVEGAGGNPGWAPRIDDRDPFFIVFAVCFPAFTGMTAGVGLSGDLAKPRRSIPLGTLSATVAGFAIYLALVYKLATSVPPEVLASDQLAMARVAAWGPIIPIGLACATLSSAIGSILVAPRTLQALARDRGLPIGAANGLLARGAGATNEPRAATFATAILTLVFVVLGDVDFVARLISMFFMVTYGALCSISFLEHFAARPSYRPSFRSRWYISLVGAASSFLLMLQMDPVFALLALVAMGGLYLLTRFTPGGRGATDLAAIFRDAMSQATRRMHVRLQRSKAVRIANEWRPSIIMVGTRTFAAGRIPLRFLGWLCERHGFGTYLHYLPGMLNEETFKESEDMRSRLLTLRDQECPEVYVDTIVSPSMRSALAQTLQVPGVSGVANNTVMFELRHDGNREEAQGVIDGALFASVAAKNLLVLRHGHREFGARRNIHVWLTWHDEFNASLIMLLAHMLTGHDDWAKAETTVWAAFPGARAETEGQRFRNTVERGRLPISSRNIRFISVDDSEAFRDLVAQSSSEADLVIMGLTLARIREGGVDRLLRHPSLGDVLYVCAAETIGID